jgi:hypothetical protein
MNGRHCSLVIAMSLAASVPALAGDLTSPAFTPRQMAHCMMRRLRVHTDESYRNAFKACKTQFAADRSDRAADAAMTAAALPEKAKP